jgi:DNA invertase Pin-like site-specific DNA recombinase
LLDENIFRDDGVSGATLNRSGLDQLRDKAKAGELDRMLLTAPDRLAATTCIRWCCWKNSNTPAARSSSWIGR